MRRSDCHFFLIPRHSSSDHSGNEQRCRIIEWPSSGPKDGWIRVRIRRLRTRKRQMNREHTKPTRPKLTFSLLLLSVAAVLVVNCFPRSTLTLWPRVFLWGCLTRFEEPFWWVYASEHQTLERIGICVKIQSGFQFSDGIKASASLRVRCLFFPPGAVISRRSKSAHGAERSFLLPFSQATGGGTGCHLRDKSGKYKVHLLSRATHQLCQSTSACLLDIPNNQIYRWIPHHRVFHHRLFHHRIFYPQIHYWYLSITDEAIEKQPRSYLKSALLFIKTTEIKSSNLSNEDKMKKKISQYHDEYHVWSDEKLLDWLTTSSLWRDVWSTITFYRENTN